jgi:hypothetical protein
MPKDACERAALERSLIVVDLAQRVSFEIGSTSRSEFLSKSDRAACEVIWRFKAPGRAMR